MYNILQHPTFYAFIYFNAHTFETGLSITESGSESASNAKKVTPAERLENQSMSKSLFIVFLAFDSSRIDPIAIEKSLHWSPALYYNKFHTTVTLIKTIYAKATTHQCFQLQLF